MKNIEKQNIEFKREWNDSILRVVCAFANTNGGEVFIGIDDKGVIVGVPDPKKILEIVPNKVNNKLGIIPDILIRQKSKKYYIVLKIKPVSVPISYEGKYYIRSGSVVLELSGNELANFLLKKSGQTWDEVIEEGAKMTDIDDKTIKDFKKLSLDRLPYIENEKAPVDILNKLNLLKNKRFKRAALIWQASSGLLSASPCKNREIQV